jgi:hypothetical protein
MTDSKRIEGAGNPAATNVACSLMPICGSAPDRRSVSTTHRQQRSYVGHRRKRSLAIEVRFMEDDDPPTPHARYEPLFASDEPQTPSTAVKTRQMDTSPQLEN